MKQALYLSCPWAEPSLASRLRLSSSPSLSISLFLSRFTSVRPSWCLARHPLPPRGRPWGGNKASEAQEATNPPWVDVAV